MQGTSLVRVTIASPHRRIDMALPEHAALAEILPGLLTRAGEGLADDGVTTGGWLLRRADGTTFDLNRTLASHRVLDGEILHLTERRVEWPELEYDDLVDAIATGSGRTGGAWGPRHTRQAGLAAGVAAMLLGLVAVLRAGPPWTSPALWALGTSAVLLIAAVVLARAVGDAGVGAVLAATALPFAGTGGGLLFADDQPVTGLSAGHLIVAGAMLLLVALVGQIGVTAAAALWAAAAVAGLLGVAGGWLSSTDELEPHEAAAVVGAALLALSTTFATLALRLGRVPMPVLPRSTADLVRDDPQPPLPLVHATVARADALLTGMLAGTCGAVMCCQVVLIRGGGTAAVVMVAVLAAGFLLRARLYPILRQRVPLLVTGAFGVACLAVGPAMADRAALLVSTGPLLLAAAAVVIVAGVVYSTRAPNAYLGRFAEYAEMLIMVAGVPVACWVLGLFGYVRGLGG
ncbi:type VII secretion integral membrane protein EccD [Dactylosporangium sp. AC04546]|uniref:type VII secretion integral membrane protein EccD n=1 Tax=Dactylosporangium sp. AC04546 TaxID=2862460 RepID=UPI001EE08452|nr:type VII secretion integral membrane protein EccD [Dactylosporangium sp. AC04546]WVK87317.1 type VII secretion integral membrane protein EccD [Dactylosporangium sp. AC04546]